VAEGAGSDASFVWGVAARPFGEEAESGDRALITPRRDGTLVAVVDGLGHGPEAALAARVAIETLEAEADADLDDLVRACHRALRQTRGAVLSAAIARDDGRLTWTGVGNVEAVVVRQAPSGKAVHEHALIRGGVMGVELPSVRPSETVLAPGDRVVFATDGISGSFLDDLGNGAPQELAEEILHRHAIPRDDALVVVGLYRRSSP
jgi:phosphoserine phosphatase RsbX